MTCERIKERIDLGDTHTSLPAHLAVCRACANYQTETASLLTLLRAQPRVAAPADYDARLQARLAQELVTKDAKLTVLLQALPKLVAPADYDFRLRARLAQTRAEAAATPLAWVRGFFAQSFSMGQAAAALAMIAIMVAFTASQFTGSGDSTAPRAGDAVAVVKAPVPAAPQIQEAPRAEAVKAAPVRNGVRDLVAVNYAHKGAAPVAAPVPVEAKLLAKAAPVSGGEQVVYNARTNKEARVSKVGYTFGQQALSLVAAKAEPMIASF